MAPLVLNLFLVTVLLAGSAWTQSTPGSGSGSTCNPLKTMGGVNYTLIEEAETEDWGCSSDCVYRKQGVPSEKWCFKPGGSSVTCGLSKYTEEECPELVPFQKATMRKDEELYLVLKDLIKCCKEKPQASSNETYINQTIINLNETVNNLICNVNHISTTQQAVIKGFTRMSEVMARLDQHGAQCGYKAMWEQAKTIITFDNTFTNDGVGSLDAATGMWTAGVSGTYAISISGYSQHDFRGENMLNLFKNGASLGKKGEWMFAEYGKDSGGRSLVLKLAKDDKLTLKAGDMASATANNNKTFIQDLDFCVFLINADGALTKANPTDWPANECPASLGGTEAAPIRADGCTVDWGFDYNGYYNGNDISGQSKLPVKDWAECSNLCAALNECLFWSYAPSNSVCWLKTSNGGGRVNSDRISGSKECGGGTVAAPIRPKGCTVEWGINYNGYGNGNDISGQSELSVKDWAECSNLCAALNECLFWSYRETDSKCWLKTLNSGRQVNSVVISGSKECGGE